MVKQKDTTVYTHRYLARVTIETETPLKIGSGEKGLFTDAVITADANGLPYIPGSALAGILRHELPEEIADRIFGCQQTGDETDSGHGSEIIFSEARMVGKEGRILDGLCDIDWNDGFYSEFGACPVRQHVRIDDRGVACSMGKFDEQVVFKGCRFAFEMELLYRNPEDESCKFFTELLDLLSGGHLRIGGGSRHGFGKFRVVDLRVSSLDLMDEDDRKAYLDKGADLNASYWDEVAEPFEKQAVDSDKWIVYQLELQPDDFFNFSSGMGDDEADMVPVTESYIVWNEGKPDFVHEKEGVKNVVIPASSIKGALAHRTAFYWNLSEKRYADELSEKKGLVGSENPAVTALFGSEGTGKSEENGGRKRGNVLIDDLVYSPEKGVENKIFNHVSIDRFTGGAKNGALFSEKVVYGGRKALPPLTVQVDSCVGNGFLDAFESALKDLASGMLPLGGGTNRGMGTFTGTLKKGNEILYSQKGGNDDI